MPNNKQIIIRICNESPCAEKGADGIMKKIEQAVGLLFGAKNEKYDLGSCGCLGSCEFGPNLLVNNNLVIGAKESTMLEEISKAAETTPLTAAEKAAQLNKVLEEDILGDLI